MDYLIRIIAKDANVRAMACVTTSLVEQARMIHGTLPTASAALGRTLTAGTLMGALLDDDQRLALKFEGSGPMRKILVEADAAGTVRGYAGNPRVDLPPKDGKIDVGGALGRAGFLTVSKDLGLKTPYSGTVQLYSSEIAEDIAYYLTESEQIPSAVGLGVYVEPDNHVSAAGGFLIQSLPPSDDKLIDQIVDQIRALPPITEMLRSGMSPEDILQRCFAGIEYEVLENRSLRLSCSCSQKRMERALIALGPEELKRLAAEEETTELVCDFCRKHYTFTREDLSALGA